MCPLLVNNFDIKNILSAVKFDKKITQFRRKQNIFSQGDRSEALFYIEKGTVKLTVLSKEGKEAIISVLGGGSFFGESCILSGDAVRFQSAVALTNVQLVKIDAPLVRQLIEAGGNVALSFVVYLLSQNVRVQSDLANRLVDSSEESLARVISSLVQFTDKQGRTTPLKISQQTLAEMVGISRQHVNALLKRLKRAKSSAPLPFPSSKLSSTINSASVSLNSDSDFVTRRETRRA
jgi:CRP/FNR family transcriptional regulator, cyclic AMP receptor protein